MTLDELLIYLNDHYDEKLTIKDLCGLVNMSKATLHRCFKLKVGTSPKKYLVDLRLNTAKSLIEKNETNKTEIALSCGFFDTSHLNKYLKKHK